MYTPLRLLIFTGVLCFCLRAGAEEFSYPDPSYPTAKSTLETVVVESKYYFRMAPYEPEVLLWSASQSKTTSFASPESTLKAFFSAMGSGDYSAWLNCWSEKDRAAMLEKNTKKGRDSKFWKAAWSRVISASTNVYLRKRILTNGYVILMYEMGNKSEGKSREVAVTLLQADDGTWRATNDLTDDPVLMGLHVPDMKVTKVGRVEHFSAY